MEEPSVQNVDTAKLLCEPCSLTWKAAEEHGHDRVLCADCMEKLKQVRLAAAERGFSIGI